jgi:peroxin-4
VLLDNPDESSPLDCDSGNLLRAGDGRGYRSLAKLLVQLHAT